MVASAAAECHLQHVDANAAANMAGLDLERGLQEIGRFLLKIRELNELELVIAVEGLDGIRNLALAEKNRIK